ncbi:hypothetical protein AVEN_44458-1 [Araneus ventricosus]|uniref:Uncharacterized protein n=1 Tax=Araneus ventricosus TaxID=182803 RepID=A0A4Y2T4P3_ARAVE|nr:hypothetical protein AVEN_44458-1 [Araneus ventricosus]
MRADCNAILKSPSVAYWQGLGRKAPDQKPYYNEDHTEEAKPPTVNQRFSEEQENKVFAIFQQKLINRNQNSQRNQHGRVFGVNERDYLELEGHQINEISLYSDH